jgi:hypothetical protein
LARRNGGDRRPAEAGPPDLAAAARPAGLPPEGGRDKLAGISTRFRIHDLRHTTAALMIQAGYPPKMLQEILGHASITTTLDLYGHLYPGDMDKYADRLGEAATEVGVDEGKAEIRPGKRRRRPRRDMTGSSTCEDVSEVFTFGSDLR